ncbi:hypothetical protein [Exiguobacterium artemiae]|nr:hypothetical protein [Exiguobacterium sibiricum]MDW2886670.1 hypothetical protein [Exiguobacterium sibiricum]
MDYSVTGAIGSSTVKKIHVRKSDNRAGLTIATKNGLTPTKKEASPPLF